MNEIKKYIVTSCSFYPGTNSLNETYVELQDATQLVCMWSDVEPIAQRNAELVEFLQTFPELNMSNYSKDDVTELNAWGIELVQMINTKGK
jgi:hypothetical protein